MIIRRYLLSTLWQSFSPIFFTLFVISAVVMLLGIASLTSFIKLDFGELLTLFLYKMPMVIYTILPISIFASLISTMAKLSSGNELIVINSLGIKPTKLVREFILISIIISILSLVLSLGINEKARFYYSQFKEKKISETKFNIKASQYGQTFGKWLIYIDDIDLNDKNNYKDMKLFQTNKIQDIFILSKNAKITIGNSGTKMILKDGKSFIAKNNEIQQIDYKSMIMQESIQNKSFGSYRDYWSDIKTNDKKAFEFTRNILFSIFPIISIFFILSLGYYNPRYENNDSSKNSISAIVIFYILVFQLSKKFPIDAIYFVSVGWFILGYIHYRIKVKRLY
jgi:lipopolysaccharide export system permease protein